VVTTKTAVDCYGGLSLSQNTLNYYVYSKWLQGEFNRDITNGQQIAKIVAFAPGSTLARSVTRIHFWPAVSPRIEIAEQALAAQKRPLIDRPRAE
jgi:hypothetical protein